MTSGAVTPDGRPLPDVVLRVSLHPRIAEAVATRVPEFTTVQRRLLRHFRDRTACLIASPPGTGRTTGLLLGALSAVATARTAGRELRVAWCAPGSDRAGVRCHLEVAAAGIGATDLLEDIDVVAADEPARLSTVPTLLLVDGMPCEPPAALLERARAATACIGVATPTGSLLELAARLVGATGGFYADCTEYDRVRVRAWAPLRDDPFPDTARVEAGLIAELVRIAQSDGPVQVFPAGEAAGLCVEAGVVLDAGQVLSTVSGISARQAAVNVGPIAAAGETVWLGSPRSVAGLVDALGAGWGLHQDRARITLAARNAMELAWCAAARVALNAGSLEPCDDRPATGASRLLSALHSDLHDQLLERVAADDERCERAALWLVSRYGLNRGNARAVALWKRSRLAASP